MNWKSFARASAVTAGLALAAACSNSTPEAPALPIGNGIAIFENLDYIDADLSTWDTSSEGSNLFAALADKGYNPAIFTSISGTDLTATIDGKGVVVIPDQEHYGLVGPTEALKPDRLTTDAVAVLTQFVNDGGLIVVTGSYFNSSDDYPSKPAPLINAVLGTSVVAYDFAVEPSFGPYGSLQPDAAAGTSFEGGRVTLPYSNGCYPLLASTLPPDAKVIYADGDYVFVAVFPSGYGAVIFLADDWYNARPVGAQDGGWNETLIRAVNYQGAIIPPVKSVSLFLNGDYSGVDLYSEAGAEESEASNEYYSLVDLGYNVRIWPSAGDNDTTNALFGGTRKVAIIPESYGNPYFDMDTESQYTVRAFLSSGGILILNAAGCDPDVNFIGNIFEMPAPDCEDAVGPIDKTLDSSGTVFDLSAATLDVNDATEALVMSTLPGSSWSAYSDDNGNSAVAVMRYDSGYVIWLGWDWYDAAPRGSQDGGWNSVLDAALNFPSYEIEE